MRKILLTILIALFGLSANAQLISPSESDLKAMDDKIRSYMDENNIPGGLVAVARKGEILELRTYGK